MTKENSAVYWETRYKLLEAKTNKKIAQMLNALEYVDADIGHHDPLGGGKYVVNDSTWDLVIDAIEAGRV